MTNIIDRLFDRTEIQDNGCWFWTGSLLFFNKEYGQIKYQGKNWLTHRLAYTLCVDDIPEGLNVLHSCDNCRCINPEHLFLGTCQDNKDDCVAKGRHAIGETIGISVLVEEQIYSIRKLLNDKVPYRQVAKLFNVGATTIWNIKAGRTWRHV